MDFYLSNIWRVILTVSMPVFSASMLYYWRTRRSLISNGGDDNNGSSRSRNRSQSQDQSYGNRSRSESFTVVEELRPGAIEAEKNEEEKINRSMGSWNALGLEQPLVIAMVGLPARGKSYIVKMITRYLTWIGYECQKFNVGSYRRKIGLTSAESNFFDAKNENAFKLREEMAMAVQDVMYKWLNDETNRSGRTHDVHTGFKRRVAIFDATNTTKNRRAALFRRSRRENCYLLFIESICDDQSVLDKNYELKLDNEDYKGIDRKLARKDFEERVLAYQRVYETIEDKEDEGEISYIKLVNVGQKVITHKCNGYLPSQVAFYLQNIHIEPRKIFLCLNAETSPTSSKNGLLSDSGRKFSDFLGKYFENSENLLVLSGTSAVQAETILNLRMAKTCYTTPLLNDLRRGDFEGKSDNEFKTVFPLDYMKRFEDKLTYRYQGVGGESYMDVIERIRPVIIELERQRRVVLLVCHQAVLRCVYGYFLGIDRNKIPYLPLHQTHVIYELTPSAQGCSCNTLKPGKFADIGYVD